jgi:cytoskeletal protein RodZ
VTSYMPPGPSQAPPRSRRGLMIVLLIVGLAILLMLALIVVLFLRSPTARGQSSLATVSASITPSASASSAMNTPAATVSPTAAATSATTSKKTVTATATATKTATTATGPQVQTFAVVPQSAISGTTVTCTKAENLMVDFSWATSGATTVDFGVATLDASAAPYITGLPASGSLGSARAVVFQCYADSSEHTQFYTLTVLSPGQKVSRTITLNEKYVP